MSYTLTWEPGGVYWKYSGVITGEEIIEGSTAIYGDERFDDLTYKLVDFTDAELIKMSQEQMEIIAYQHKAAQASNYYIKTAIVVNSGSTLAYSFAKFFKDLKWDVEVFEELDKANEWLERTVV